MPSYIVKCQDYFSKFTVLTQYSVNMQTKVNIITHNWVYFTLFAFLVSRDCCVALPHEATGLSAVCDYSIF